MLLLLRGDHKPKRPSIAGRLGGGRHHRGWGGPRGWGGAATHSERKAAANDRSLLIAAPAPRGRGNHARPSATNVLLRSDSARCALPNVPAPSGSHDARAPSDHRPRRGYGHSIASNPAPTHNPDAAPARPPPDPAAAGRRFLPLPLRQHGAEADLPPRTHSKWHRPLLPTGPDCSLSWFTSRREWNARCGQRLPATSAAAAFRPGAVMPARRRACARGPPPCE